MQRLRESLAKAPIIWKGDYPYFIHPITDGVPRMSPDILQAITDLSRERIDWSNVDLLLGIEAMGLPLTAPLSMSTGIPLVIARKRTYGLEGEVKIDQFTGYSKGAMFLNDIKKGERIAIIDDVLSTGGTLEAVSFSSALMARMRSRFLSLFACPRSYTCAACSSFFC